MLTHDHPRHPQTSSITQATGSHQSLGPNFCLPLHAGTAPFLQCPACFPVHPEGNSPFQQPRASRHAQYDAARCPLPQGDPSWARLEVLGPLRRAAGAALICILPLYRVTHHCAGEGESFGDIFSYNTFEISPLISMLGCAPFSTHPLVLSSARRLIVSSSPCTELPFSSSPAFVSGLPLPRVVINSKSWLVLPPVAQA